MVGREKVQGALGSAPDALAQKASGADGNDGLDHVPARTVPVRVRIEKNQKAGKLVRFDDAEPAIQGGHDQPGGENHQDQSGNEQGFQPGVAHIPHGEEQAHKDDRSAQVGLDDDQGHGNQGKQGRLHHALDALTVFFLFKELGQGQNQGDFGQLGRLKAQGPQAHPALGAKDGMAKDEHGAQKQYGGQVDKARPGFPGSVVQGDDHDSENQPQAESQGLPADIIEGAEVGRLQLGIGGRIDDYHPDGRQAEHREDQRPIQIAPIAAWYVHRHPPFSYCPLYLFSRLQTSPKVLTRIFSFAIIQ